MIAEGLWDTDSPPPTLRPDLQWIADGYLRLHRKRHYEIGFGTSVAEAIEEETIWHYYYRRLRWRSPEMFDLFAQCCETLCGIYREDYARKEEARLKRKGKGQ